MAYGKTFTTDGTIYGMKKDEPLDLAFSPKGTAWVKFKVSVYQGKDEHGEYKDSLFVTCMAFKDLAENIVESLKPGDPVIVVGELKASNWTTKEGEKRYDTVVMCDTVGVNLSRATAAVSKAGVTGGANPNPQPTRQDYTPSADPVKKAANEAPF